ncbi:MAG: hypothetical protein ACE5R6_10840 [Candidatus Heimdallarchaeota archaeon]
MVDLPAGSHFPPEHKNHLCFMVVRENLLTKIDLNRVKQLVSPANYVCQDCGRVAAKAENLCNPMKL